MNARKHGIIVGSLLGIAVVGGLAGGAVGYRLGRQSMRQESDPETWHERAARRFEEVVRPTAEQAPKLDAHLQKALAELKALRLETIERSAATIDRLVSAVEAELTPEQKGAFEQMKPRRGEMNLELLEVERPGR